MSSLIYYMTYRNHCMIKIFNDIKPYEYTCISIVSMANYWSSTHLSVVVLLLLDRCISFHQKNYYIDL